MYQFRQIKRAEEEIDRLIDHEVDVAYRKALELLTGESKLHQLLIEGMMEFKTLDYDEMTYYQLAGA